jgi:hypothetical protein
MMMSLCYFFDDKAKPSPTNPPIAKTTPPAIAIPISPSVNVKTDLNWTKNEWMNNGVSFQRFGIYERHL